MSIAYITFTVIGLFIYSSYTTSVMKHFMTFTITQAKTYQLLEELVLVDEYVLASAQVMAYTGPRSKNFNHLGCFVYNLTSDP